jgi:serine/threonine protein phosphatase PrpC
MWRKATSSAIRRPTVRYRFRCHVPTLAFALSAAISIRPVSTMMEEAKKCPSYGCPLVPQDVYYQEPVKAALTELRLKKRDDVSDEDLKELESSGTRDMATLTLIGYKGGPLEKQINQDRAFCVVPYNIGKKSSEDNKILGVFDGHANLGERVSQYTVTELPKLLASKLKEIDGEEEQVTKALIETFIEMDKSAPAEISGGCTASVILQKGPKVYFANAGDSRSFLVIYRAESQKVEVVYITREDKPSLPDEKERVEKMGGQVYLPIRGTSRVLYVDPETGMQSGLAMSRSIGDWEAGKLGVIPDPLVDVVDIPALVEAQMKCRASDPDGGIFVDAECDSDKDDVYVFAVSATDGMMDFATPEIVANTVATSLYNEDGPHLLTALEQLIYMAAQGWEQSKQGRYRDDIAVVVSQIRIPPTPPLQ